MEKQREDKTGTKIRKANLHDTSLQQKKNTTWAMQKAQQTKQQKKIQIH